MNNTRKTNRTAVVIAVAFVLALAAFAPLPAQTTVSRKATVSIHLAGIIPRILKMDLDFASAGSVAIIGTIGSEDGLAARPGMVDLSGSGIANLGSAHIYGNIVGNYIVSVSSENGGKLVGQNPENTTMFGYRIILAGNTYDLSHGTASYSGGGFTGEGGSAVPVAIAYSGLDGKPAPSIMDRYTDSIMFSLASN